MLLFYLWLFVLEVVKGDDCAATSTHDMTRVLEGENDLLKDLRLYVAALEQKVKVTRMLVDDAVERQQQARIDPVAYIANPLNSLPMLRRMRMDAAKILQFLQLEAGADLQQISDYRLDVITKSDLEEAAKGLLRIQQIYDLEEQHMAQGLLTQKQFNARLSSLDCLTLARHLRKKGEEQLAIKWLEVALSQFEATPQRVYQLMKVNRASILQELGRIEVDRENWLRVRAIYEQVLEHATRQQDKLEAQGFITVVRSHLRHIEICRGWSRKLVSSSLRCRYDTLTTPFLRLAPLKLEQLSLQPHVLIYHDVIYAHEQAELINQSRPYLRRSLVGDARLSHKRLAMNALFNLTATELGQRLSRRISDMSGFDLSAIHRLSVQNYGIAGHYYTHLDCWLQESESVLKAYIGNNRIATVLLYLTDVAVGGITSFPALELGVQPRKGSALIWHNMNNAAECDGRTLHGACPVLLGNRWVATLWIDRNGQWRTKRCQQN